MKSLFLILLAAMLNFSVSAQVSVAFDHDGKYAITGGGGIKIWDMKSKLPVSEISDIWPEDISISADNKFIAIAAHETEIYNFPEPKLVRKLPVDAIGVEFVSNSKNIVIANHDGSAELWDIEKEVMIYKFTHTKD